MVQSRNNFIGSLYYFSCYFNIIILVQVIIIILDYDQFRLIWCSLELSGYVLIIKREVLMYIFKGERNVVMYFLIGCFNVMYCRFSNVNMN